MKKKIFKLKNKKTTKKKKIIKKSNKKTTKPLLKKVVKKKKRKFKKEDIDDIAEEELEDELEENIEEEDIEEEVEDEEDIDEEDIEEDIEEEVEDEEEVKVKKRGPKPKKEEFYVEPKKFDDEIVKYYESGVLTDELAQMVNKIAHKLSYAGNFINYTYRDDMVGDALIRMFKALMSKKYDREKGTNPFSYFTRIAFNAFRNRIKKEKHINETHLKYREELFHMSENYNSYAKNNKSSSFDKITND